MEPPPPDCLIVRGAVGGYGRPIGELVHLQSANAALRTIVAEHDRLLQLLMGTIDLVEFAQAEGHELDLERLREATGRAMQDSIRRRARALAGGSGFESADHP